MQYVLVPEEANEAIAYTEMCIFYLVLSKIKGVPYADSAVDALGIRYNGCWMKQIALVKFPSTTDILLYDILSERGRYSTD